MKEAVSRFAKRQSRLLCPKGFVLLCLLILFCGCATTNKETRGEVSYHKIPFSEILASPEQYKGKTVRLGGVIIETENREEETVLEILERPLNWRGRPKSGDVSGGRFLVIFARFLDEAVYRPHQPVTIVGEIIGTREDLIGQAVYHYPLLSGKDIRLWQDRGYFDGPRIHIGVGIGGRGGGVSVGTTF